MIAIIILVSMLFIAGCQESQAPDNQDQDTINDNAFVENGDTVVIDGDARIEDLENMVNLRNLHHREFTRERYYELLDLLSEPRYRVVPAYLLESTTAADDEIVVSIRHDIDYDPYMALKMGTMEAEYGFQSTYYILHSASYFGYYNGKRMTIYGCNYAIWDSLAKLGHEIGDHNDYITMEILTDLDMKNVIKIWHESLLDYGITVYGSAAHGASLCNIYDFANFEYFSNFNERDYIDADGLMVPIGRHSIEDLNYVYEGYHIEMNAYYSDVGGHWAAGLDPLVELPELETGKKAIVLAHPVWWDLWPD